MAKVRDVVRTEFGLSLKLMQKHLGPVYSFVLGSNLSACTQVRLASGDIASVIVLVTGVPR